VNARTPLLPPPVAHQRARPVEAISETELAAVCALARQSEAVTVMLGHGRDDLSQHNAHRFAAVWEKGGGAVLDAVSWPEQAASWLRKARRLTDATPDLWVLGGPLPGLAQLIRRLAWSTSWEASRTLGLGLFRSAGALIRLTGADTVAGMRGGGPDGEIWQVADGAPHAVHPASTGRRQE